MENPPEKSRRVSRFMTFSQIRFSRYSRDLSRAIFELSREMGRTADLKAILKRPLNTRYVATRTYVVMDGASHEVDSMASSEDIARNIRKIKGIADPMSITGLQQGVFQAKLAEMRQKIATTQTQALADIDGVVTAGTAKLEEAAKGAAAKAQSEIDDALQEFATLTNGGPA